MLIGALPGLIRLVSRVMCLIVIASFTIFAVNQTSSASDQQTKAISGGAPTTSNTNSGPGKTSTAHESTVHKAIDEASDKLTSPFASVTSGSSNQWVIRGVKLLLALLVYGLGLGFLARMLRLDV